MTVQFVEPDVSRAKFGREIAEFRDLEQTYRERGWFLVRAEYPQALVLITAPQLNPPAIVSGVAFDYTNYDAQAPSVRLINPFTAIPYQAKDLPPVLHLNRTVHVSGVPMPGMPENVALQLNQQQPLVQFHAPEDIPFLCLAGVREYHDHPGHTGDVWELHRTSGAGRLVRLLEIIHKYGVQPITGYGVSLIPQVGFQIGQAPE